MTDEHIGRRSADPYADPSSDAVCGRSLGTNLRGAHLAKSEGALPSDEPGTLSELTHRGSEWRWLNTVSFWVATSFAIGSMLFITGAAISIAKPLLLKHHILEAAWKRRVMVDYVYAIGAGYFQAGAYLGFFEVINVGKGHRRLFAGPSSGVSLTGYWSSLSYLLGATSFGLACVWALFDPKPARAAVVYAEWLPQAVGGCLFTVAAVVELVHNRDATWRHRVFWVCILYLLGSALFWVAASTGLYQAAWRIESEQLTLVGVDLPYLVGSVCFLGGSWLQLQMWHAEQFGLGFIRELNLMFSRQSQPIKPVQEFYLALYALNGALSAINICLSVVWHRQEGSSQLSEAGELLVEFEEILSDVTAFVAAHAMLLLATAVRFTPTLEPYGYLVKVMRGLAHLLLFAGGLRCAKYVSEVSTCKESFFSLG